LRKNNIPEEIAAKPKKRDPQPVSLKCHSVSSQLSENIEWTVPALQEYTEALGNFSGFSEREVVEEEQHTR